MRDSQRTRRIRKGPGAVGALEMLEGRQLLTASALRFSPPVDVPLTGQPNSVVLADFNRDGRLDLASALGGADVGVALGNGDGTFQEAQLFRGDPSEFFPTTMAVTTGDFNNDGKPDLVLSTFSGNAISVLLNTSTNGELSFDEPLTHGAGASPVFVAVGDFNRDGNLDVATANIAADPESSIGLLLGKGDGTFEDVQFLAAGGNPNSIAVGDFNRDGRPDLAVSYSASSGASANRLGVLLGVGDGSFRPVRYYAVGTTPISIAVGDFNRDGKLDLAVANVNSDNVSVLIGDGKGAFKTKATYRVGKRPVAVAAADFNADGRLDLAVANAGSSTLAVLTGQGNGKFNGAGSRKNLFSIGAEPSGAIAVGMISRPRLPDVAIPTNQGRAAVLLNWTAPPKHRHR